jgi:hypothetical protein
MAKEAVFTMKLEPELRDAFMAEAAEVDRPASQIVRELMKDFVKGQVDRRNHDEFVRRKVELARRSMDAGIGRSDEEVSASFARKIEAMKKSRRKSA